MVKWIEKQLNILLIDEEEKDYILTRRLLTKINGAEIELDWVTTYEAGLEQIASDKYDAYLVDDCLDKNSGLDLVRAAIKNGCQAPLILLSGHESQAIDLAAVEAGAADYLVKDQLGAPLLEQSICYAIERKQTETALQETRDMLEERVAERTVEVSKTNEILKEKVAELEQLRRQIQGFLERRTRQVETSTAIAQDIATIPNLDGLFRRVVNLVQQRFGYYHVHVYTLEDDQLIMQEGTGEAGRKMKDLGHKIPLGVSRSLVAQAARNEEPVLVSDVYQEPHWLPNPLLPETKSEIAAPIMLRDEVLGVLDVQNNAMSSLNQEDQIMLMGLCGQIAVAINNRRLEAKRKQAEEAQNKLIEDLNAFAHTVSYSLRDPLDLIVGYTRHLKEQARLPEELQEYLNAIARNGHKMSNIIEELQLFTGIQREEVELKPLNMARIVAEVQQRLAYLIQEYQAKIVVSEYWPVTLGHKPWVEQVWANYFSNAIKYGGQPPHVHVGATAQSDGMVRFWVRDNGPGFTSEEQGQLFTEFTHLKQVRIRGYSLGLSIVRRIITKLGGQVGVESDGIPGNGTTFSFTLPSTRQ
jgi:signal transduction histidine kinase/DNA-binding response OmpR family regulator